MTDRVFVFPDGNTSAIPDDVNVSPESVSAAVRVLRQFGAADLLPMLGVTS